MHLFPFCRTPDARGKRGLATPPPGGSHRGQKKNQRVHFGEDDTDQQMGGLTFGDSDSEDQCLFPGNCRQGGRVVPEEAEARAVEVAREMQGAAEEGEGIFYGNHILLVQMLAARL
jgi:hypothetical protein